MNKLFTKVATLCVGLAMAAGVGVAVGSAKASEAKADYVLAYSFDFEVASTGTASELDATSAVTFLNTAAGSSVVASASNVAKAFAAKGSGGSGVPDKVLKLGSGSSAGSLTFTLASTADEVTKAVLTAYNWPKKAVDITVNSVQRTKASATAASVDDYVFEFAATREIAMSVPADRAFSITKIELYKTSGTPVTSYSVTDSVEHGSVSPSSVNEGATLTATITPDTGYELPATLTDVTMGGSSVVYSYNNSTGVVEVNNVTGNIVISGTCPEKQAPQHVDLPDGDYTATLPYANPFPTEIDVLDGQSAKVAALTSSVSAVKSYDDTHHEYVLAKDAYFEINNLTNGVIKSISFNLYQFRNMNVFVDDSTTAVYTGDGQKGSGDPVVVEVETNAQSKIKVVSNGGTGSYDLKMYSLDINIKVGTAVTPVTGVSLNAQSGKIAVGTTRQLTATVAPSAATNKNVSWSAEPESVATVSSSGLVTGVAAGEAVITVTTEDGGFTASYAATVGVPNYGTENAPLTVEEAREALEYTDATVTSSKLYVYGKVYSSKYSGTTYNDYTIWLTNSDESVDKYFEIYGGEISEAITSDDTVDDALKGETVICHGYGKVHNGSTFELLKANDEKPSVAKYEAPQPATYEVSFYQGETKLSSEEYAEGAKVTIPQPNAQLIPEGKEFDYWEHKESGDHYAPGVEFTVGTSSARFDAVYKDAAADYWSNEILAQFATVLHGAVPNYDDSVKTLAYNADYNMFLMPEVDSSDAAEAQLATLCTGAGWELYSEGGFYYFDTEDGIGYAMGRVYQMSDTTYAAVLRFIQNAYEKDMADLFKEHLGIVPPYFDGFPTYIYHEGKFVCEYIDQPSDLASDLSYYQEDIESYGLTSLGEARTEKIFVYNGGSSGEYNATIYAYGAYLQDGGLLIVEVYTMFDAYLGFNIYYQAMPVSIAVSGEYKTSYEYGEEFSADGIVVTATMSDATSLDVSSDVEFSGFDSSVAGEQTVTVTYGTLTTDFVVTVNQPAPTYDADAFAKELLEKVAPICANYDGKKNNRTALKEVWTEMAVKYGTLSEEEKAKVVAAAAKADGTDLEKAMAFYNFACKKYGLTKFIAGRQVKAIVNEPVQNNSILPIIVIVASSVAAVTAIGVVIALKRRKSLLTK